MTGQGIVELFGAALLTVSLLHIGYEAIGHQTSVVVLWSAGVPRTMERMRRLAACRSSIAASRAFISESRNSAKNRFGICGLFSVAPRAFKYFARSRSIFNILPGLYPPLTSISDSYLAFDYCRLCNARASR